MDRADAEAKEGQLGDDQGPPDGTGGNTQEDHGSGSGLTNSSLSLSLYKPLIPGPAAEGVRGEVCSGYQGNAKCSGETIQSFMELNSRPKWP